MSPPAVLLAALAVATGCAAEARAPEPPPPAWAYAPPATLWQAVPLRGRIGRSQPPQLVDALGLATASLSDSEPLSRPTPWTVPGDGPARAIVSGSEGVRPAVELIDVDAGTVIWRDTTACAGPVVGVTATVIVCADAKGTRALGLDGKPRWALAAPFVAMTDERVVLGTGAEASVIDATDGDELARVKLPAGVIAEEILAACGDAGRELLATQQDRLVRVAEGKGGAVIAWSVPMGAVTDLDACTGDTIVATTPAADGDSLLAIARASGATVGRLDGVRGHWRARDGSDRLEVALANGLRRFARTLAAPGEPLDTHAYGALIAERAHQRLVRTSPQTAVLLDERGVRAYLPFASMGAVLGASAIVASSWTGSASETVRRFAIPARYRRNLRLPARRPGVGVPAELRDLPREVALDLAAAIGKPDTGKHAVAAIALDPVVPHRLYTVALERAADDDAGASVAAVDLETRAWKWQRADGCGPGVPVALAVAADVVACAARSANPATSPRATVRATSHDGASRWEWQGVWVDALQATGDLVAVHDANTLHVLDARTGRVRDRVTSDDGHAVHAALVPLAETTYLVTAERGRIVVRVPVLGRIAIAAIAVDGTVRSIERVDGGVHVALEDGDAYHVDLASLETVALPALGLAWAALGDVVGGVTVGGPIPGVQLAPPALPVAAPRRRVRAARPVRRRVDPRNPIAPGEPDGARLWTPIAPPPPLGDSWQLQLFEAASGSLRARNDYALRGEVALSRVRGPVGSPIVVASGDGLRDVLVLDPRTGDPLKKLQLPEDAAPALVFGTVVAGTPVAGALLVAPLRVIVF